ncbi:MAG TPA: glycoside hydrolase domain-containing protein [Puia sp.]|nr:glycoside hydrolase domain-containing protein [Puia sp.]
MKKIALLFSLYTCCFLFVSGQDQRGRMELPKVPPPQDHYQDEYTFDRATAPERWITQKEGLQVSFVPTDQHYFRTEVPDVKTTSAWADAGWKGERLNAMILVWSPDTLSQVRFVLKDLVNSAGQVLSKKNIQLQLVRYVASNYPYNARDVTCDVSPYKDVYLMPDRFEAFQRFDVPGRTVRPVWVSLDIPSSSLPGVYHGTVEVQCEKYKTTLTLTIRVQKPLLPKPAAWEHRLDLWQNPWVIAWYNHVEPWSEEHKVFLRKHLALYAGAGGKYITTYAVHSPWSDNSYMIEETMIEWVKRKNDSWAFDYTIFDQYVQLAMEAGINKAITIYTPVPWGNRFRFLDEKTGNYVYEVWAPGSAEFSKVWNAFLSDLQIHLVKKGWLEKTYLGINENTLDQTLAAIKVIKAHSKKWKITYAGNWHKELDGLLDDYCFLYGNEPGVDEVKARSARGFTSTYYICCNPPKPNDFIFSPPVEGRWLGWYSAAHQYNGFLRWAYDAWPADPARDARHTLWPAGDCFLVYPGGNSCVRFEKLREGIVDFEKIRILRKKLSASPDKEIKRQVKALDDHLNSLLTEHDFNTEKIISDVDNGRKLIEALSDKLQN